METAAQGHQLAHRGGAARLLPLQIGSKRETEEDWGRDRRGNKKPRLPRGRERGGARTGDLEERDNPPFGWGKPMSPLILERAKVSRPSGQWRDDDYDVLEKRRCRGSHFQGGSAPQDRP